MCQSKADGGLRCASHVTDALYAHADKQIRMVKEFATENGMTLPDGEELYAPGSRDSLVVNEKAQEKPAYKKAEKAADKARIARQEAEFQLASVVGHRNPDSVAAFLWQRDTEAKGLLKERDRAFNNDDDATSQQIIAKLKGLRAKTAAQAQELVDISKEVGNRNLLFALEGSNKVPAYLEKFKDEEKGARENFDTVRKSLVNAEKERFISRNLRESEQYKTIAKSIAFRVQPQVQEWEKKQKEHLKDYSMTSEYREKMEALATHHPEGSPERDDINRKIAQSNILRDLTQRRNRREAETVAG